MLELGATFFGFTMEHMLWKMTFAQILTLVETRNERERRAYEEAEKRAKQEEGGDYKAPSKDVLAPSNLPSTNDVARVFGSIMG